MLKPREKTNKVKKLLRQTIHKYSTGQFDPDPDLGRTDGLTQDDIEWALEQGAVDDEEVLDFVSKHKTEVGR